mmetsp:Transcript_23875/g.53439  ORF Transcript_23875/g.53439 Transcript_23875/m.53439 type:complete len:352 (+) Transcript_23875:134-1189(+)
MISSLPLQALQEGGNPVAPPVVHRPVLLVHIPVRLLRCHRAASRRCTTLVHHPPAYNVVKELEVLLCVVREPRGQYRDADAVLEVFVDQRTEYDVGVLLDAVVDQTRGAVDVREAKALAAGDVENDTLGVINTRVEKRTGYRRGGRVLCPRLTGAYPDPHQGRARVAHDRPDVGEVDVDDARLDDDLGNPHDALTEDVVGYSERTVHRGILGYDIEESVIRHDDDRVNMLLQPLDGAYGLPHPALALEPERLGDDTDSQSASLPGYLGDDGCSPTARPAAHAARDEAKVGPLDHGRDLRARLLGGELSDFGVASGAQASRCRSSDVENLGPLGLGPAKGLSVSVDRPEVHA